MTGGEATGEIGGIKFTPLGDRVIIRRATAEERSKGGSIIIPDAAREKPLEGVVVACGPGASLDDGTRRAMGVCVGDRVLFGQWVEEIMIGEEKFAWLREDAILGVIDP